MRTYLRTVLDHAPGDLVLSTHQSVGYHYEPALLGELLGEYPRVVGVNVTHRDLVYVAAGRRRGRRAGRRARRRADARGRRHRRSAPPGYLSSEGNLAPRLCVALIERIDAGDHDGAVRVHAADHGGHEATQALGGIVGAKAALRALGGPAAGPGHPGCRRAPSGPSRWSTC